jgi:hypothetical protein
LDPGVRTVGARHIECTLGTVSEPAALADFRPPVGSLDYRPRDYFVPYDLETRLLTRAQGRAHRAAIREALVAGEIDLLPAMFKAEEFNGDGRDDFGRFGFFMGGR